MCRDNYTVMSIQYIHYSNTLCFRVGNLSVLGEYGCVKKITQFSTLSASMSVGAPSGVTLHIR